MKKHTTRLFLVLLVLSIIATICTPKDIKTQPITATETPKMAITEDFTNKRYIAQLVNEYADYYGVSRRAMHLIVANESNYNYKAYNQHDGGHNWSAYGLVQINMRFWGNKITPEMAKNPHYALDFLAREINEGNGDQWTTYRVCVQGKQVYYQGKKLTCDTSKVITV